MSDRRRGRAWHRSRLTALLLAVALLGACQAGTVGNPPGPAPTGGQRQPAPIRFAGRASTTTRPFLLAGGLVVARAEHRGSGGFKVEVLDQDGAPQHVLFLATGRYRGSSGVGLRGGIYRLAVSGATPWKGADRPAQGPDRGRPATAVPWHRRRPGRPFQAGGRLVGDVEHHGREDITLELLSDQGASLYFLLEDSGPLQTSRAAQDLQAGGYYLKVEATQAWECGFTVARELLSVRLHGVRWVGS